MEKRLRVSELGVEYFSKAHRRYYKCEVFGTVDTYEWLPLNKTSGMSIDLRKKCYIERIGW